MYTRSLSALFLCIIGLAVLSLSTTASAGYLSAELESSVSNSQGDEYIRVIISPNSGHSPKAMKMALVNQYSTRADRYRAAVTELKAVAVQSQSDIVQTLTQMEKAGSVRNVKTFWIDDVIEVEVLASELDRLASQGNIEKISEYPNIVSIPTPKAEPASLSSAEIPSHLNIINAPAAWALGYDGTGRIVCSFDSGVKGDHPALSSNYRGNKGYPAEQCWFSPVDTSTYPHDFTQAGLSRDHGTHTTGTMVGHDDLTGDTIGVAPGADWIAALTIDVPGASIFEAFQWAVDPDGNPNTITDLPDVINNSWGIEGIGCADVLWNVIDNVEALGVVVIFSAGNEGPSTMSLRNPANRADDSLTNFAIGAYLQPDSAWNQSARGPSDCDGFSIKPNVIAPGVSIRSSLVNGSYGSKTGTSMAAPHVSGAVAILRQKNPDATVDQIKTALLNSAADQGEVGPDNTFGWGLIDITAALDELDALTTPSLQVAGFDKPEFHPGGFYNLNLSLKNIGANADNVIASFANPQSGIESITSSLSYGDILPDETVSGGATFDIQFGDSVVTGKFYTVDMTVTADGGYTKDIKLSFFLGPEGERTYFDHSNSQLNFTISNYGAFGFHEDSYIPYGFSGFAYGDPPVDGATLYEGAFIIGYDSAHVSDCARNVAQEPDNDFKILGGGSIVSEEPGIFADQETTSLFDDSYAENPIGLEIKQRSYSFTSAPDLDYVILEFIITNTGSGLLQNLRAGLYMDWDIVSYSQNKCDYNTAENVGYIYYPIGDVYRGVAVLTPEGLCNHRAYIVGAEVSGSRFNEGLKAQGLLDDTRMSYTSSMIDLSHMTVSGPFDFAPGASDTVAFAIIGGDSWSNFITAAIQARQKYADLPTDVDDDNGQLPRSFTLYQNAPNPFNPVTDISFAIPKSGIVAVQVFDVLGRSVKQLTNGQYPAGEHKLTWDGTDESGNQVSSGVYFYRVQFENDSQTRKMVLMK